jgi:hypothetical protein
MSPVPMVRAQAVVVAVLLVAAAVLGAPFEVTAIAAGVGVAGMALRWKYRSDMRRSAGLLPPHRDRLDLLVSGDLRASTLLGLAVALTLVVGDVDPPDGVGAARSVVLALLAVAACVYLSSLVDWYVILPRISGQLGARPCRSSLGQEPGVWPKTWAETTSWWYLHRLAAAFALRFGLGYAVTLAASGFITFKLGPRLVSMGLLGLFVEYSPLRFGPIAREAMQTQLAVGSTVRRVRRARHVRAELRLGPVTLFALHRKKPLWESISEREYVYDVSVEGVKFVSAASREGTSSKRDGFVRETSRISLRDIDEAVPAGRPFSGCEGGRCSGVNWYCIENPRCFAKK